MARLFADEDFKRLVVDELRLLGHDLVTAHEAGRANKRIPDADQLAFAVSDGRAVITFNRWDFIRLHRQSPDHSGIIVCTNDPDVAALAGRIHQAVRAEAPLDRKLIRINKPPSP
jgi:hypothetical protein